MTAFGQMAAIARIELLRLLRTRIAFTLLFVVPVLQVVLFGTAIQPQGATAVVAIAGDNAAAVARAVALVDATPGLVRLAPTLPPGGAATAVREGRALIGIELPQAGTLLDRFAPPPPVRVIVDAAEPALTAVATARLAAGFWRARATAAGTPGPVLAVERLHDTSDHADWGFLPGLSGVVVMISTIMLGSLSLAREREAGTWEALRALPIGAATVMAGKLLPYVVITTLQGLVVLGIGIMAFDLPVRGSIAALALLLPLFAAAHLALGYAIAARSTTQLAALQGAVAFYLPAMLLSGFLYPFATLPPWAQALGRCFPLTHYVRAARAATLGGSDPATVLANAPPIAAVLILATALALVVTTRKSR